VVGERRSACCSRSPCRMGVRRPALALTMTQVVCLSGPSLRDDGFLLALRFWTSRSCFRHCRSPPWPLNEASGIVIKSSHASWFYFGVQVYVQDSSSPELRLCVPASTAIRSWTPSSPLTVHPSPLFLTTSSRRRARQSPTEPYALLWAPPLQEQRPLILAQAMTQTGAPRPHQALIRDDIVARRGRCMRAVPWIGSSTPSRSSSRLGPKRRERWAWVP